MKRLRWIRSLINSWKILINYILKKRILCHDRLIQPKEVKRREGEERKKNNNTENSSQNFGKKREG